MSLDQSPEPTLSEMKGRLENLEGAWNLAASPDTRRELNEKFKALADEIRQKFGQDGKKAVDQVVARHMQLQRAR